MSTNILFLRILAIIFLHELLEAKGQQDKCSDWEFLCEVSQRCIPRSWLCDGSKDCGDSADENHDLCDNHSGNSSCFGNQPECFYGGIKRCILHEWLCDGHKDCDNGEDETNCERLVMMHDASSCGMAQFTCDSGACIPIHLLCDNVMNCMDGSDESEYRCLKSSKNMTHVNTVGKISSEHNLSTSTEKTTTDVIIGSTTPSQWLDNDSDLTEKPLATKVTFTILPEIVSDNITANTIASHAEMVTISNTNVPSTSSEASLYKTKTTTREATTTESLTSKAIFTWPTLIPFNFGISPTTKSPGSQLTTKNLVYALFPWLSTTTKVPFTTSTSSSTREISAATSSEAPVMSLKFTDDTSITEQEIEERDDNKISTKSRAKTFKQHIFRDATTPIYNSKNYIVVKNSDESQHTETYATKSDEMKPFDTIVTRTTTQHPTSKKQLREIVRPVRFVKGLQIPKGVRNCSETHQS